MRKRKRFSVKISSDVSVIVCRYCRIFPYGDRFALVELCNQCSEETEEEKEKAKRQKITAYPIKRLKAYLEKMSAEAADTSQEEVPF